MTRHSVTQVFLGILFVFTTANHSMAQTEEDLYLEEHERRLSHARNIEGSYTQLPIANSQCAAAIRSVTESNGGPLTRDYRVGSGGVRQCIDDIDAEWRALFADLRAALVDHCGVQDTDLFWGSYVFQNYNTETGEYEGLGSGMALAPRLCNESNNLTRHNVSVTREALISSFAADHRTFFPHRSIRDRVDRAYIFCRNPRSIQFHLDVELGLIGYHPNLLSSSRVDDLDIHVRLADRALDPEAARAKVFACRSDALLNYNWP